MGTNRTGETCVACERGTAETPLIRLRYRDGDFWICPQHLPLLIHEPSRLVGKLPGAEDLRPSDIHD